MFTVADRVQETTNSPGTGTATLLGAVSGYQSFSTGIGANNTTYYVIADQLGTNWEVGLGALNSTGTVLTRTTVYSSSNGGSTVNFATGLQYVWCDFPSSKAVIQGTAVNFSSIGATTAGTGAFTTLSASSTVSGAGFSNYFAAPPTIGNTTPNAGTFTALVATSITDSGLTAGRVNYNGVGGLLQDSANMVFDGTTITSAFSGPHNGTVGATTASTGAFTTLGATGVFTASAGTSALPSIVTSSGSTSGLYSSTANVLGIAISAASVGTFTATGLNGMAVGATTTSTGAFTTLSASGTVSGTGFSTYLASPPAIGGTAAAAGTFTTLAATTVQYATLQPIIATTTTGTTITPDGTKAQYNVTALASATTIAAPSGTPTDGQKLIIRFKDNGTARGLTWTVTSGAYRAIGVTLPTTTVLSKVLYIGCIYNAQDTFWDVIAVAEQ